MPLGHRRHIKRPPLQCVPSPHGFLPLPPPSPSYPNLPPAPEPKDPLTDASPLRSRLDRGHRRRLRPPQHRPLHHPLRPHHGALPDAAGVLHRVVHGPGRVAVHPVFRTSPVPVYPLPPIPQYARGKLDSMELTFTVRLVRSPSAVRTDGQLTRQDRRHRHEHLPVRHPQDGALAPARHGGHLLDIPPRQLPRQLGDIPGPVVDAVCLASASPFPLFTLPPLPLSPPHTQANSPTESSPST